MRLYLSNIPTYLNTIFIIDHQFTYVFIINKIHMYNFGFIINTKVFLNYVIFVEGFINPLSITPFLLLP